MKKNYFIIGGTSSIGIELIKKLDNVESTSKIYFSYFRNIKLKNIIQKKYSNTHPIKLNLEIEKDIKKLKKIKIKFDAIILAAAETTFINIRQFKKFTPSNFKKILNINLSSQYSIIYNISDKLKKNSHIIFLSSVASKNSIGSNAAYSAAKSGINNLTLFFSRAFEGKIKVNSIAPGLMKTNLTKNFNNKYFQNYLEKTLTKKLTKPSDISNFIINLITNDYNITGQIFYIDGAC